jgi:hypothetical protein
MSPTDSFAPVVTIVHDLTGSPFSTCYHSLDAYDRSGWPSRRAAVISKGKAFPSLRSLVAEYGPQAADTALGAIPNVAVVLLYRCRALRDSSQSCTAS